MKKNAVICAIDVNDFDQNVVDLAAEFAKHYETDLELVHVTLMLDPTTNVWPANLAPTHEMVTDNRRLKTVETSVEGVELHRHHLSGDPVDQIVGVVERNEPRLLVLGTHARKGIQRVFGSVANRILRRAPCPVMVLRQRQNSQTFSDLKSETI